MTGQDFYGEPLQEHSQNQKRISAGAFHSMNLLPSLLKSIRKLGYKQPTPIQRKSIPPLLRGLDVVGMARTGSGKTAAFAIPLVQALREHSGVVGARGLVVSPTRELAAQTYKSICILAKGTNLKVAQLVGGEGLEEQFGVLAANPDIIIATPGRLVHLTSESKLSLKRVQFVVFDEADRLFEMGFAEQLKAILGLLPASRQIALFSATLPSSLSEFVSAGLRPDAVYVRLDNEMKLSPDLGCEFVAIKSEYRVAGLLSLLEYIYHAGSSKLTIVFTATKHHVEYLQELLSSLNFKSVGVYGSMDQEARVEAIESFRTGKCPILIVTDLAARGLDIPLLDNVINYDMPATCKLFIHRVGRAARAGRTGTAYSLCAADELPYYVDLKVFLNLRPELFAFPQDSLDVQASRVSGQHSLTGNNLEYKWKVLNNAYKRYHVSRPAASPDGYTQAKLIQTSSLPIAAKFLPGGSCVKEAEELKAAIHNYKPKGRTILNAVSAKSGERKEAKQHADKEFFMSYQPKNSVNEDRIYSLQHSADTFLPEDPLERRSNTKGTVKNGKKRTNDLAEKYEQWRKKTHVSLPKVGEPELPERLQSALAAKKNRRYGKK